jgi:hypothetical protein
MQAFKEELDAMQAEVQTRVRKKGADHNRLTGEALFVSFVERTSRRQRSTLAALPHSCGHAEFHLGRDRGTVQSG